MYLCGPRSWFFHLYALEIFCVTVRVECCSSWKQGHVNAATKINQLQAGAIQGVYITENAIGGIVETSFVKTYYIK